MILAIETATNICGVAIVDRDQIRSVQIIKEKNVHAEKLMPIIDQCLSDSGMTPMDMEAIAVSIGPGSFTGLRIGLSTAKGLALGASRPLIPVPTLSAIAKECLRSGSVQEADHICSIIDAKRDEAFYQIFSTDGKVAVSITEPSISSYDNILAQAGTFGTIDIVGDGLNHFPTEGLGRSIRFLPQIHCHPVSVGILASGLTRLNAQEYFELEPLYLRDFVAKLPNKGKQISSILIP